MRARPCSAFSARTAIVPPATVTSPPVASAVSEATPEPSSVAVTCATVTIRPFGGHSVHAGGSPAIRGGVRSIRTVCVCGVSRLPKRSSAK